MSEPIEVVETEFSTDFAILQAHQRGAEIAPGGLFVNTRPGCVYASCGNKYARVRVRAERWDDRPPAAEGWEDTDELPFMELAGQGPLMLGGFDLSDVGLDVSGLGLSRVQVFARGRHRYWYSGSGQDDELPPEEWLVRFFPAPGPADPLAGGPRRIGGVGGLAWKPRDPWRMAVAALKSNGWYSGSRAFYITNLALGEAAAPLGRRQLAAQMVRWLPPYEVGGADSEDVVLPATPDGISDHFAEVVGRPQETIGELIDVLCELGLLLRDQREGEEVLVPNPVPVPAWQRLGLTGDGLRVARVAALRYEHGLTAVDLRCALAWAGKSGLRASPAQLAVRWATTPEDVWGAVRMLAGADEVVADRDVAFDAKISPFEELQLIAPLAPGAHPA